MGAIEEGGKVAGGIVEGLKTQPLSLALITMNLVFVVLFDFLFWSLNDRTVHQYEVKDKLIEKLVAECKRADGNTDGGPRAGDLLYQFRKASPVRSGWETFRGLHLRSLRCSASDARGAGEMYR